MNEDIQGDFQICISVRFFSVFIDEKVHFDIQFFIDREENSLNFIVIGNLSVLTKL